MLPGQEGVPRKISLVGQDYNSLPLWESFIEFEVAKKNVMRANAIFWQVIRLAIRNLMQMKIRYSRLSLLTFL
jgi:hypothetical protein